MSGRLTFAYISAIAIRSNAIRMKKRVVITGMGVVSPNGIGNDAFCRAILDGTSGVKRISRFDASTFRCRSRAKSADFDELAWMDAHERKHVSRVVPLALAAVVGGPGPGRHRLRRAIAERAARDRRCAGHRRRRAGILRRDVPPLLRRANRSRPASISIPSGTAGTLASELSMRFGFRGMSHVITTGCTSSTDALGYALRQIQHGYLPDDAGGRRRRAHRAGDHEGLHPDAHHDQLRGTTLRSAPRGRFPPIATASLSPKAPGCSWSKTTNTRKARGAQHSGRRSPATAQPARHFIAYACRKTVRSRHGRFRWPWKMRALRAADVDYVNLHGTSTELNDRIETRALKLALGAKARTTPMSSLKSQIGHPQGASGAAGVAATLIAMHHRQIPPTINLETPDPQCDLDYVPQPGPAGCH